MKFSIKKTASILLAALMLLMLFGCGSSAASDQKKLEGTWKATVNMTDLANDAMQSSSGIDAQTFSEYFQISKFELIMIFTFRSDGTYSLEADEAQLNKTIDTFMGEIKDGMVRFFEDTLAEEGIDMSVDEFLQAQVGMSIDEYFDETFSADMFDSMADEFATTGKWKAENGKLYTTTSVNDNINENEYELYEFISSTEVKLSLPAGAIDPTGGAYPIVLKKS